MAVSVSDILEFLDTHHLCEVRRHEISSAAFSRLRRGLRSIALGLQDGDETANEISRTLRTFLSEWLTVPIPFSGTMLESLAFFGTTDAIASRWGNNIRDSLQSARMAAEELQCVESPLRAQLGTAIRELRDGGQDFRIFCHRRARPHFESIMTHQDVPPLNDCAFLHSAKDYREVRPFDALIKVGPLRSRGWGSAPDALVTAPRFRTLIQVVWSGCSDEPGFGYDPVFGLPATEPTTAAAQVPGVRGHGISLTVRRIPTGEAASEPPGAVPDEDEFQMFERFHRTGDKHKATLVQIDEEHGILYGAGAEVLTFAPHSADPIAPRLPGDTLTDDMFIVVPDLGDAELGGQEVTEGYFSRIWKARLGERLFENSAGFCCRLREAGIGLLHLQNRVEHWCDPATTVIHAPKRENHFKILIESLEIDFERPEQKATAKAPWWKYAWNEIRRSRGEAIQSGMHEHELLDQQLLCVLKDLLPQIRRDAEGGDSFSLPIPESAGLRGTIRFFKVRVIEEGFDAPDAYLRQIDHLNSFEQWRA